LVGDVVWLEDDPEEDRVSLRRERMRKMGMTVVTARGFRQLELLLRERSSGPTNVLKHSVGLLILDIMIEGITDLGHYFPWVEDGRTANGFAAGLVFLDRVLSPATRSPEDDLFGRFEDVPVIVYSNRALSKHERSRVSDIAKRRLGRVVVLEKALVDKFFDTAIDLVTT